MASQCPCIKDKPYAPERTTYLTLWCQKLTVFGVQRYAEETDCQPTACTVMCGCLNCWSLAEWAEHLEGYSKVSSL